MYVLGVGGDLGAVQAVRQSGLRMSLVGQNSSMGGPNALCSPKLVANLHYRWFILATGVSPDKYVVGSGCARNEGLDTPTERDSSSAQALQHASAR